MHVHHVLGKLHALFVALCPGCHSLVTDLGRRVMLGDAHKVADLITLARFAAHLPDAKTIVRYKYSK